LFKTNKRKEKKVSRTKKDIDRKKRKESGYREFDMYKLAGRNWRAWRMVNT